MKSLTIVDSTIGRILHEVSDTTFQLRGQHLTQANDKIIKSCLSAWLHLSLDLGYGDRLQHYTVLPDIGVLFDEFSFFAEYLLTGPTLSQFKAEVRKGKRFTHIFPAYGDMCNFIRTSDASSLGRALTWLTFMKKVPLDMPDLNEKAITDWLSIEDELAHLNPNLNLISDLSQILKDWFCDFRPTMRPRHGGGSVSEGPLCTSEKYANMKYDKLLQVGLFPTIHDQLFSYSPLPMEEGDCRTSRLIFVPKTYKKLRSVCPEPVSLQYFQQAFMNDIYHYIHKHPYLKYRIPLTDQSVNRIGARIGSSTGAYATIDLSSASDSMHWETVKLLFQHTPLLRPMIATRSRNVRYGEVVFNSVKKYAPMGSALCFPTECLIFSAVCEYVGRRSHYNKEDIPHYSVYGDDIIVPTSWYPAVRTILEELGFHVNREKTFSSGSFRESCGAEYYNGTLLPHVYYKVSNIVPGSVKCFGSLVSLANRAGSEGFQFLRSWCIDTLLKRGYHPMFSYDPDQSDCIYSSQATNFHLRSRWNAKLFRQEYYSDIVLSREELDETGNRDIVALFEWLSRRPDVDELTTPFVTEPNSKSDRLLQRWRPLLM